MADASAAVPGRNASQVTHAATIRDQVLAMIRQSLISGEIGPGELYSAAALAEKLGVSTSPVREAMSILVNDGWLAPVRNRGFRVVEVSAEELEDIYYLRRLLEIPPVAKIASGGIDDHVYTELRAIAERIEECARQMDIQGFLEADREFHLRLLAQMGNARLVGQVATLRDQSRLYGVRQLAADGALDSSAAEHAELVEAVHDRDADLAEAIITRHLNRLGREWSTGRQLAEHGHPRPA